MHTKNQSLININNQTKEVRTSKVQKKKLKSHRDDNTAELNSFESHLKSYLFIHLNKNLQE